MPGVGDVYEPTLDLLKGVAIQKSKSELKSSTLATLSLTSDATNRELNGLELKFLKYFPAKALPCHLQQRFDALFEEQSRWKIEDLVPYFDEFGSTSTIEKIFLRYTRTFPDEKDSSLQWYVNNSTR